MQSATMPASAIPTNEFSIRKHLLASGIIMCGLVFGVGGWAASASLSGAIISAGSVVVERNVKKVQHSYGGIVAEINVRNGDQVKAGEILLRLDPTQLRAELGVLEAQLIELTARAARLRAERDGANNISWPAGFQQSSSSASKAANGENRLFNDSRKVKASQKEQLRMKLKQINEEVGGLTAQRTAKGEELIIVSREVNELKPLLANKLTTATKVNSLERDLRRIEGEHGSFVAQTARARSQIAEIELQILGIDESVIATSQRDLVVSEARLAELAERVVAARDKLNRIDIRAPRAGLVHELSIHTIGGVVSPAEQLMLIVPDEDKLTIQARIQPHEIDQVKIGRPVRLRMTAFNQQTTPEIDGSVSHVAGDITVDPKTGGSYYLIRIEMDDAAKQKLGDVKLQPGMPVEVFVSTGDRTVLSYLAKPFSDQMKRAFRE